MLALRELQSGFADYILKQEAPALIEEVNAAPLTRERRLNVYRNNTFTSLSAALTAVYPAIEALVGKDFFQQLAKDYVKQYPSNTGDLHDFGEAFADYIQGIKQLHGLPYLIDVARLEWHYHIVFHAADARPFDLSVLQTAAPKDYADIRFVIHPATRLLQSIYPVLDVWRFTQNPADNTLNLNTGGQLLAVRRRNNEMDFQLLKYDEFIFIQQMQLGQTLNDIETVLAQTSEDFDLQMLLVSQVQNGNIINVKIPR